jgi:hypothetical protein
LSLLSAVTKEPSLWQLSLPSILIELKPEAIKAYNTKLGTGQQLTLELTSSLKSKNDLQRSYQVVTMVFGIDTTKLIKFGNVKIIHTREKDFLREVTF